MLAVCQREHAFDWWPENSMKMLFQNLVFLKCRLVVEQTVCQSPDQCKLFTKVTHRPWKFLECLKFLWVKRVLWLVAMGSSVQVTVFFVAEDMQQWFKTVNQKSYVCGFISFYLLSNKDFFFESALVLIKICLNWWIYTRHKHEHAHVVCCSRLVFNRHYLCFRDVHWNRLF